MGMEEELKQNLVSVDCLMKPSDVFKEMQRVLKSGDLAIMSEAKDDESYILDYAGHHEIKLINHCQHHFRVLVAHSNPPIAKTWSEVGGPGSGFGTLSSDHRIFELMTLHQRIAPFPSYASRADGWASQIPSQPVFSTSVFFSLVTHSGLTVGLFGNLTCHLNSKSFVCLMWCNKITTSVYTNKITFVLRVLCGSGGMDTDEHHRSHSFDTAFLIGTRPI